MYWHWYWRLEHIPDSSKVVSIEYRISKHHGIKMKVSVVLVLFTLLICFVTRIQSQNRCTSNSYSCSAHKDCCSGFCYARTCNGKRKQTCEKQTTTTTTRKPKTTTTTEETTTEEEEETTPRRTKRTTTTTEPTTEEEETTPRRTKKTTTTTEPTTEETTRKTPRTTTTTTTKPTTTTTQLTTEGTTTTPLTESTTTAKTTTTPFTESTTAETTKTTAKPPASCREDWDNLCDKDGECCSKYCKRDKPDWATGVCDPNDSRNATTTTTESTTRGTGPTESTTTTQMPCRKDWDNQCDKDVECCSGYCKRNNPNWLTGVCDPNDRRTTSSGETTSSATCRPDDDNQCDKDEECCSGWCWRGSPNWATGVCKQRPVTSTTPSTTPAPGIVSGLCTSYGGESDNEKPRGLYTACGDIFHKSSLAAAQIPENLEKPLSCGTRIRVINQDGQNASSSAQIQTEVQVDVNDVIKKSQTAQSNVILALTPGAFAKIEKRQGVKTFNCSFVQVDED